MLADWRGDALPKEPNKRRPAVVVEDDGLFAPSYPNAILVPLTEDDGLVIPDLVVAIAPTAGHCHVGQLWLERTRQAKLAACRPSPPPT
ncbi:type II toxin-antitoxin system PemK/MazF family toxin, partial [Roseomonas mucosa]|uniref:type II toxin-antitoxin system PemK/MazF family toxin n=1 Tax=Roseomonas mucosa TaxID=207340 RepID=UPI0028CC80EA